ncbi:MAG: VWA domain-containing protein [Lentimicrobiaceae bacterium]|jgi:Ca-activated chloride channel family protein|nr:VWA domain-containing protein [Lentimicrobiaceae bacterium]MDD4596975.1 VWA domain-containing protein [Lentimicrobiaceae bacterium]MDY0026895.1 VWA domain-containing protein [Lentimicrobium sp.]
MFRFEHPFYIQLLLLLPLFVVGYWMYLRWKKRAVRRFGDTEVVSRLMPGVSKFRSHLKFTLLILTLASILLALANPQIGSKLEKVQRKGIDLIIALDVSNSMLAEDIQPNRLNRARQSIARLIDEMQNDRIGLIIFAGKAYVQLPITTDYNAAKLMLSTIKPDLVPVQGTAIGQALETAMTSFQDDKSGKAVIIITDGENHEDDAVAKAAEATKRGIKVFTIGMGSADGAPIPVYNNNRMEGFKKDQSGTTIITRLDESMLRQIAEAGDGIYVRASNSNSGLKQIFDQISKLDQNTYETHNYADYENRFQYFIALALIFMVLNFLLNERKSKWADKFSIFETKHSK